MRLSKYILIAIVLLLCFAFVAKFGGPELLKFYLRSGIGDCQKIPILCMAPTQVINVPAINREYLKELLPYKSPKMAIRIPKGFSVYQEIIKKVYYKKLKRLSKEAVVYLLAKPPNFFTDLFPKVKKQGIADDYTFIRRTMYAKLEKVKSLSDVFFVIMKGIFIPDLGDQRNVVMAEFSVGDKRGFINYNLGKTDNYFDCNVLDTGGNFFKIYIQDKGAALNLDKVLAIISSAEAKI